MSTAVSRDNSSGRVETQVRPFTRSVVVRPGMTNSSPPARSR
ncbi:hypothetical protein ACFQX7_35715 [Luedemannella flava]